MLSPLKVDLFKDFNVPFSKSEDKKGVKMSKSILLILPARGLYEIYDEQGIALIASYLRLHNYNVIMKTIKDLNDIDLIELQEISIVGITSYHENLPFVYEISQYLKMKKNDIVICLGGYSATYYAEEILKDCIDVDIIIEREGEQTFLEICQKLEKGESLLNQKGIIYRNKEGKIIYTGNQDIISDLSLMPYAAKDIFEEHNMSLVEISTSRGCLNNCSFCYSHSYFDPRGNVKWRGRTAENVVEELKIILSKYKVNKIYFNNASFEDSIPYKGFMLDFCHKIIENKINISFCVNFRANFYKHCTEEEIKLLCEAGLTGVFLGIEAFNQYDLKTYNKHTTLEDNLKSIDFFRKNKIGIDIGFININPYSSYESLKDNAYYLYKTNFLCSLVFLNRLRGYKDTPIYWRIKQDGLLKVDNYLDYYCYNFKEKRVGEFTDFMTCIFGEKYKSIPANMYYFTMYNNQLIAHLNRIYKDNILIKNIIKEYDNERTIILNETNSFCYTWYKKILELLRVGWNCDCAKEIIKNDDVCNTMQLIEKELKIAFFKFTKKIISVDKNASFYLQ